MIIRSLRLRHGRIALPRQLAIRSSRRWQSTEETEIATDADSNSAAPTALPAFQTTKTADGPVLTEEVRTVPLNDPNHPVAQNYAIYMHQKKMTAHLGSSQAPYYKPHELLTNPPSPKDITLELLIASQTHIGHSTSLWNPANARYIFGVRGEHDPIHIISPDVTASHLRRACKVVNGVAQRGGLILFVGTRQGQARAVVKAAELAKGCHLFTKWIPGSITNGQQILGRCQKKVVNELDEDVTGFEDQLFNKAAIKPDLVVCLNPRENYILLHECGINNIPTIGVIDTDTNPTWVTYPIPANDDSLRAIQVIAGVLGRAGQQGQQARLEQAARTGVVTYPAIHGLSAPSASQDSPRAGDQQGNLQNRRSIRARRYGHESTTSTLPDEPTFPSDFENIDARQNEKDNALLNEAERELFSSLNGTFPGTSQTSNPEPSAPEPETFSEMDAEDSLEEGDEEPDNSLTDEYFAAATEISEQETKEEVEQFGTLEGQEWTDWNEVEAETEGESPMEQVGEVEEELGEQAPESQVDGNGSEEGSKGKV